MSEIEIIKNHASGRWPEILLNLAPHISPMIERGRKQGPCPLCGGKDRSRCHNDFNETGGVFCNQCGGGSDGIAVLQWANGWDFKQTVEAIESHLGLAEGQIPVLKSLPKPQSTPKKNWEPKWKWLQMLWDSAIPGHPRLQRYMEHRGLSIDPPPSLRLHKGLKYLDDQKRSLGEFPCMVARIVKRAEIVGLHVTFLDPSGPGKADVPNSKKIWKCAEPMIGGSIRLFDPAGPDEKLALCEGVETALAIRELTGFAVWACGNAVFLERVEIPSGIGSIYIGADKDRSGKGELAAYNLADRLFRKGYTPSISYPPMEIPDDAKGVDWLDYLAQNQEVANG